MVEKGAFCSLFWFLGMENKSPLMLFLNRLSSNFLTSEQENHEIGFEDNKN